MTHDLPCLPCPMTSDDFSAARKNGKRLACERMYDEMVELRELVRDMHRRLCNARLCGKCPDSEACGFDALGGRCTMLDDLEGRMRELGIEVG
jgi:hypothetical protein